MPRPNKQGLDYFPLDVTMDQDEKIQLIELEEPDSFGVIIRVLMRIYNNGYYLKWSVKNERLFSISCKKPLSRIRKIVELCLAEGFFNNDLYKKYEILTSKGIQERYFTAIKRRKSVNVDRNLVIVDINSIVGDIIQVNDSSGTQSKVKKSKVKESKEYKRYLDFINLTDDEHKKLSEKFGSDGTQDWIKRLNEYIGSKGDKYKSHYHTILMWNSKNTPKKIEKAPVAIFRPINDILSELKEEQDAEKRGIPGRSPDLIENIGEKRPVG